MIYRIPDKSFRSSTMSAYVSKNRPPQKFQTSPVAPGLETGPPACDPRALTTRPPGTRRQSRLLSDHILGMDTKCNGPRNCTFVICFDLPIGVMIIINRIVLSSIIYQTQFDLSYLKISISALGHIAS